MRWSYMAVLLHRKHRIDEISRTSSCFLSLSLGISLAGTAIHVCKSRWFFFSFRWVLCWDTELCFAESYVTVSACFCYCNRRVRWFEVLGTWREEWPNSFRFIAVKYWCVEKTGTFNMRRHVEWSLKPKRRQHTMLWRAWPIPSNDRWDTCVRSRQSRDTKTILLAQSSI